MSELSKKLTNLIYPPNLLEIAHSESHPVTKAIEESLRAHFNIKPDNKEGYKLLTAGGRFTKLDDILSKKLPEAEINPRGEKFNAIIFDNPGQVHDEPALIKNINTAHGMLEPWGLLVWAFHARDSEVFTEAKTIAKALEMLENHLTGYAKKPYKKSTDIRPIALLAGRLGFKTHLDFLKAFNQDRPAQRVVEEIGNEESIKALKQEINKRNQDPSLNPRKTKELLRSNGFVFGDSLDVQRFNQKGHKFGIILAMKA